MTVNKSARRSAAIFSEDVNFLPNVRSTVKDGKIQFVVEDWLADRGVFHWVKEADVPPGND